jgi:hypothetical protein
MRFINMSSVACVLFTAGVSAASAQAVEPLKVLEQRGATASLEKRLAREAVLRRQKEKTAQAGQLERNKEAAAAGGTGTSGTSQPTPKAANRK